MDVIVFKTQVFEHCNKDKIRSISYIIGCMIN